MGSPEIHDRGARRPEALESSSFAAMALRGALMCRADTKKSVKAKSRGIKDDDVLASYRASRARFGYVVRGYFELHVSGGHG